MVNMISFGNPFRKLYNCLTNKNRNKSQYFLIENIKNRAIDKFPNNSWKLPVGAETYSKVLIGKKSDEGYYREVVTFYDKQNKMLKRCFDGTGINKKIRTYEYDYSLPPKDVDNGGALGVRIKKIKKKECFSEQDNCISCLIWKDTGDEEQYVTTMLQKIKNFKIAKKLHINKNDYTYDGDVKNIKATCTEYPINLGFEPKDSKKVLSADISLFEHRPILEKINQETNVDIDKKDEFLPYRLLLGNDKQECLAQHFLDKKNIGDERIYIATSKSGKKGNVLAYFSSDARGIVFKKIPEYLHSVRVAAHEAEHAYQHCQIGRLGVGDTGYEKKCFLTKGKLTNIDEIEEAIKYADAKEKYPDTSKIEDLANCKEYTDNYLEVKAREAGEKALKIYSYGRNALLKIFKFDTGKNSF